MQTSTDIKSLVHDAYSQTARSIATASSTELGQFQRIATAFGYTADDLQLLDGANMGLSCGNPVATASLLPGEVVVDLGCGGGMDIILASGKVGDSGKVYGIDISEDMLVVAKKNIRARNLTNIELLHSSIDSLPLPSQTANCILSNCVLNLVPADEKLATLCEVYRVLKPGGRLAVSDIVERKLMPKDIKEDAVSYVGCVAGAIDTTTYRQLLEQAGFQDIVILNTNSDLSVYISSKPDEKPVPSSCCSSQPEVKVASGGVNPLLKYDINEYVASCQIYAIKPE